MLLLLIKYTQNSCVLFLQCSNVHVESDSHMEQKLPEQNSLISHEKTNIKKKSW